MLHKVIDAIFIDAVYTPNMACTYDVRVVPIFSLDWRTRQKYIHTIKVVVPEESRGFTLGDQYHLRCVCKNERDMYTFYPATLVDISANDYQNCNTITCTFECDGVYTTYMR